MFRESENRPLTISCKKKKKRKKERRIPHTGTIDRINNENVPSSLRTIVEDSSYLRSIEINLFGKQLRKFVYRKNLILTFFVPSNTDIHRVKEIPTKRSKNNSTR